MKHILLLIAVAFAAHAFELDFTKNVYKTAWWSANKQLDRCSLTVQKDKRTGVQALCAQWDGSVTNYMHAMLVDGKDMPVFKRAKFTAVVSVNMPLAVNAVQLRLQDKNLETFYWKKNIKFDKPGTYVLEYVVDTERLAATSISSFTKDANKTIDFPLSTFALSFNFPQDGTPGEAFIHSIAVTELTDQRLLEEISRARAYEVLPVDRLPGRYTQDESGFIEFYPDEDSATEWIMNHLYSVR